MDITGSPYLFALATVSVTFVGFAALLLVYRQTVGGKITRYDTYFTLSFIQVGFIVTAGALFPPLLALYGWREEVVWRVSSAVFAILILWFVVALPKRRQVATGTPAPRFVWALLTVQALSGIALTLCALGALDKCNAVYATAMSAILVASGIAYLVALGVILPEGTVNRL